MAFDVAAGLASAGEAVSKVAGLAALEQQKSGLEAERLKLANDLATQRQVQQQGFEMTKLGKVQEFTGAENEKNRAAQLEAHKISAGASIASAQIHAASIDKQIAAMAPLRKVQVEDAKIETAAKKALVDAHSEYVSALEGGDADKADKAIQKLGALSYSPKDEVAQASLYQQQAKLIEAALSSAMTRLATLQSHAETMITDEGKQTVDMLSRQVKDLSEQYRAAVNAAQSALDRLPQSKSKLSPTGAPPLGSFLRVTPPPLPGAANAKPPGLIDQGGP